MCINIILYYILTPLLTSLPLVSLSSCSQMEWLTAFTADSVALDIFYWQACQKGQKIGFFHSLYKNSLKVSFEQVRPQKFEYDKVVMSNFLANKGKTIF